MREGIGANTSVLGAITRPIFLFLAEVKND